MPVYTDEPLTDKQRKKILKRVIPKLKECLGDYDCKLYDAFESCTNCPFGINNGDNCELRAVLGIMFDDARRDKVTLLEITDFETESKPEKPQPYNRFADLE